MVRCKKCGRRLFDGSVGYDIIKNEPKVVEIVCPRCGVKNYISSIIYEKVIVRLGK